MLYDQRARERLLLSDAAPHGATTEALWQRFRGELSSFIRRRVSDDATAEDILQDVFVRVHEGLGSLADEERVGAWLFRIARNAVVDHHRRARPHEPLPELHVEMPERENENQVVGSWLQSMIGELPDTYREAVQLVEVDGVSQKDAADKLGLSVSGAKSRVQRGRAQLRRMLARCCHVELDRRGNAVDYETRKGCC